MNKLFSLLALMMGLILYFAFSWGYVFYRYWYWFVEDIFIDLPTINYLEAVGLMMFVGLFHNKTLKRDFKEELYSGDKITHTVMVFIIPWMSLFGGWLVYIFLTNS